VELDLDAIREVRGRLVDQHVPAGHEVQAVVAREEEAARTRERAGAIEGVDARGGEQQGFDHDITVLDWQRSSDRC
jgi:hypothetical protein